MPYGRKRKSAKNKKMSRRIYKNPSISKLKSKKVDTLIEKVAERIAKKEAKKAQIVLIKRNYVFAQFDPRKNLWSQLEDPSTNQPIPFKRVDYQGCLWCINRNIIMLDHSTNQSGNAVQDIQTQEDEVADGNVGTNLIAPAFISSHGRRHGHLIKLHSLSITLRITFDQQERDDDEYLDDDNEGNSFYNRCELRYAIVRVKVTDQVQEDIDNNSELTAEDIFTWDYIGYSSKLDKTEQEIRKRYVKKTLARGRMFINYSRNNSFERTVRLFHKFKNPQIINYEEGDWQGMKPKNYRYYLVARSNAPSDNNLSDKLKPIIMACTKMYYTQSA